MNSSFHNISSINFTNTGDTRGKRERKIEIDLPVLCSADYLSSLWAEKLLKNAMKWCWLSTEKKSHAHTTHTEIERKRETLISSMRDGCRNKSRCHARRGRQEDHGRPHRREGDRKPHRKDESLPHLHNHTHTLSASLSSPTKICKVQTFHHIPMTTLTERNWFIIIVIGIELYCRIIVYEILFEDKCFM